ncbi:MAG: hypothetical protein LBE35_06810 [Clostridiales bacterium]|jgi:hypothetical protein|nr:hypothetical protein [Clostridiales bacterium]
MANIFPVRDVEFRISTRGAAPINDNCFRAIGGMESFAVTFDNGIDEWNPLDQGGWARRMVTTKSLSISLAGKRVMDCDGNNYVSGLAFRNGEGTNSVLQVNFPDGGFLQMDCVVNVTACGGGGASDVAVLEFDCLSNGRPFYRRGGTVITNLSEGIALSEGVALDVSN